jgi:hypothetical protein
MAGDKKVAPVDIDKNASTEVAKVEGAEPPVVQGQMAMGETSGEVGASDIKFPTLRIVQKMSENPDKLDLGLITLDGTMLVGGEANEVRMSVLSMHKYYREVLPYGAGTMPQSFDTAEEAIAAGFRIARSKADREAGCPIVEDAARAIVAIEKPEGAMDRAFPYDVDGVRMTAGIWWIQSSAYPRVAKYVFSKLAFDLRQSGLLSAVWQLKTEVVHGKKGEYYVPVMKLLNEERSEKFLKDIKEQIKI